MTQQELEQSADQEPGYEETNVVVVKADRGHLPTENRGQKRTVDISHRRGSPESGPEVRPQSAGPARRG